MTKTKEIFSIVEEYDGLMKNIYNHVKPLESDFVELLNHDGSSYEGYWSHTVGDIALRFYTDLSFFYYGDLSNLPKREVKDRLEGLVASWREEIKEETKGMSQEEKERFEESFFEDASTWAFAYIDIMLYDKNRLDSEEQEEFKEFDNVLIIATRLKDEYGRNMGEIADEVDIGINRDSDMDKILEIVKKEIDEKVNIVNRYFGE